MRISRLLRHKTVLSQVKNSETMYQVHLGSDSELLKLSWKGQANGFLFTPGLFKEVGDWWWFISRYFLDRYSPLLSEVSFELPGGGALEEGGGESKPFILTSTNQLKVLKLPNLFLLVMNKFKIWAFLRMAWREKIYSFSNLSLHDKFIFVHICALLCCFALK